MRIIAARTYGTNLPSLNKRGSNPAPGALKYDVSEGSKEIGVACRASDWYKSITLL